MFRLRRFAGGAMVQLTLELAFGVISGAFGSRHSCVLVDT